MWVSIVAVLLAVTFYLLTTRSVGCWNHPGPPVV